MADGSDSAATQMVGLKERFAQLPDSRSTINRRHLLVDVVVISVCGVLAGADGPTAIFTWADCAKDWLKKSLELPYGIPSKDCIRRVLQGLQPEAFQQCFAEWLNSLVGPAGAKFLSIDGKTLRRSHDEKHQLGALHLVSVWANEQGLTLGQVASFQVETGLRSPTRSPPSRCCSIWWMSKTRSSASTRWALRRRSPQRSSTKAATTCCL